MMCSAVGAILRKSRMDQEITIEQAAAAYSVSVIDIAYLELAGKCPGVDVIEYAETVLNLPPTGLHSIAGLMSRSLE